MQTVPLQPVPAQTLRTILDGQNCEISIYLRTGVGLFFDLSADGVQIVSASIALNGVGLVARYYTAFQGELMFIDSQGETDPDYAGFGSRYQLVFLTAAENALIR